MSEAGNLRRDGMNFGEDHFALFGLPRAFRIDLLLLESRYREIQAQVHPDRFVDAEEADRRRSLQRAAQVNEALQTLKKPRARAAYLLQLNGQEIDVERNTAMPADFLLEQMEWREGVQEARAAGNHHELEGFHLRLREHLDKAFDALGVLLDDRQDWPAAADQVRRLMFLEKLLNEIDDALITLEE